MSHDLTLDIHFMMQDRIGEAGISKEGISSLQPQIETISKGLQDLRRLGQIPFQDLPYHAEAARVIARKTEALRGRFENFLLLGIGGSSLGAEFLISALGGRDKKIHICDHVDADVWRQWSETLDFRKTLLIVVSKSGSTLETLSAFLYFSKILSERVGAAFRKHIVIVTDPQEGPLRKLADQESMLSFDIPPGVGGRFSVLGTVGLLPAACLGVPILDVLEGACRMDERCKRGDPWFNPALMSAILHYLFDRGGRRIRPVMTYGEGLQDYGRWFAQLWAESLGKRFSLQGQEVRCGNTPIAASGPQDQHSQMQLYLEGPEDKVVTFVGIENRKTDIRLENVFPHIPEMAALQGRSVPHIERSEMNGTAKAMADAGRPCQTILLPELNAQAIGELIFMAEMEVVYAGELFNINPFNQPAVEQIKRNVRDFLQAEILPARNRNYII